MPPLITLAWTAVNNGRGCVISRSHC